MKTLDVLINEAAASGGLDALTLWRLPDGRFQANASEDRHSWRCEIDANPAAAVARALGAPVVAPEPANRSIFD